MKTLTISQVSIGLAFVAAACSGSGGPEPSIRIAQEIAAAWRVDPDDVMSDSDLTGSQSVTAAQMQSFLKAEGGLLASYKDPGTGDSAATIIAAFSKKSHISPVYMLARIETESGLVEGGTLDQLDKATGCGCPDDSVCDPHDSGFRNQINCAATRARGFLDDLASKGETDTGWRVGDAKDTLDPCAITPANAATAAMYAYTPWVGEYSTRTCGHSGVGGTSLMAMLFHEYARDFPATQPTPTPVPAKPTACGVIEPDHGLLAGESLKSCDGRFELAMKTDGNLVWSGPPGAMWSTDTDGKGGDVAVMQTDGNFVLYDADSHALWASKTYGHDADHLALDDSGNLAVDDSAGKALWQTDTELPKASALPRWAAASCSRATASRWARASARAATSTRCRCRPTATSCSTRTTRARCCGPLRPTARAASTP